MIYELVSTHLLSMLHTRAELISRNTTENSEPQVTLEQTDELYNYVEQFNSEILSLFHYCFATACLANLTGTS